MTSNNTIDAARVELLLSELRLPGIKLMWAKFAEQSDKEGWPAARFLAVLAEHEMADRSHRRIERHLAEARLPTGKTLATFDFDSVPMVSKAQVMALASGDAWLGKGANILLFGPPGGGKSHLAAALGLALIENGWRVMFARTTDLVQRLQVARRELALESAIAKLDRYDLLILDDIAYVTKGSGRDQRAVRVDRRALRAAPHLPRLRALQVCRRRPLVRVAASVMAGIRKPLHNPKSTEATILGSSAWKRNWLWMVRLAIVPNAPED